MTTKPAPTRESVRAQIETEDEILRALHDLACLKDVLDETELRKTELIRDTIPLEIQQRLDEIDIEFDMRLSAVRASIAGVESFVKLKVVAYGQSVKGARLHAVYMKGKRSWDLDKLDGYMAAHPEIKPFHKDGEASAQIREVKKGTN